MPMKLVPCGGCLHDVHRLSDPTMTVPGRLCSDCRRDRDKAQANPEMSHVPTNG